MSDAIEKKDEGADSSVTVGPLTCDVLVADHVRQKHPGKPSARIVETAPREYELYDIDGEAVKHIADGLATGDFGIRGHAMRRPDGETVAAWLEARAGQGDAEARRLLGGGTERLPELPGPGRGRGGRRRRR